jgi:hypothetical protein
MAINTYSLETGSTFNGVSLTGASDFSYQSSGSSTQISTDGSRSVNLIVVDKKVVTITLNGVDPSVFHGANAQVGKAGALVLKAAGRSAGDGVGNALTMTFGETVLISFSPTFPNEGNSTITANFEAYSSTDSAIIAYS